MLKTSLKNNGAALYQELASNVCLHAEVFFLKAKWMKRLPRGTLSPRWVDEGTVTSKTSCRAAGNKCRVNPATRNAYKGLEVKVPRPGPSGADHAADARQGSMRWQRHLAISSFYC